MKKIELNILKDIKIWEKFKNDFTYHSSAIEGSKINEKDNTKLVNNPTQKIISQELKEYLHDEVYENRNLGIVFDKMISELNKPFTNQMLLEWHKILKNETNWSIKYPESVGKFRKMNVDVGDSVNFALSFEFISENMKNFIDDINYPRNMTIDDVAEFHCRFERIHPFLDGNGRIGRLIMLKQCIENNITPFIINNNTKDEYINSMKMYHQTGLWSSLLEYCKKQQQIFKFTYMTYEHYDERITNIISYLNKHKSINRNKIEKMFNIRRTAALFLINKLLKNNIIVSLNSGRHQVYILKIK